MKLLDVNVLLYAVAENAPQHARVHKWLEDALNGDEPVGFAWIVLLAFIRIGTNPKAFPRPLLTLEALDQIDDWLKHPNSRLVCETNDHWELLKQLVAASGTAGNLTTDAHLATLAICLNATLASCDSDFRRFPGLRWENPMQ